MSSTWVGVFIYLKHGDKAGLVPLEIGWKISFNIIFFEFQWDQFNQGLRLKHNQTDSTIILLEV